MNSTKFNFVKGDAPPQNNYYDVRPHLFHPTRKRDAHLIQIMHDSASEDYSTYYERNKTAFKDIDPRASNRQRLDIREWKDLVLEVVKNPIDHGKNMVVTHDPIKGEIYIFNEVYDRDYDRITFAKLKELLTTFKNTTDSNFNEGLTSLLFMKVSIEYGNYRLVNRLSEDGYFQDISSESSHVYLKSEKKEFVNPSVKMEKMFGWKVTLFTKQTEKIFQSDIVKKSGRKKINIHNLHDYLLKLIEETLNEIYFTRSFPISYLGKEFKNKMGRNFISELIKGEYRGDIFYSLKLEPNTYEGVQVFWQLKNGLAYQLVPSEGVFDDEGVSGKVILTRIGQFANPNRRVLQHFVKQYVQMLINNLREEKKDEIKLVELLKDAKRYIDNFRDYLNSTFYLSKKYVDQTFSGDIDYRMSIADKVVEMSNFIYTLKHLFERTYAQQFHKIKLFPHPDEDVCPVLLDAPIFKDYVKKLNLPLRVEFKNHVVGTLVQDTIGQRILFNSSFFDSFFECVNPKSIDLNELQLAEPENPLFYPNDLNQLEYLFDEKQYLMYDDISRIRLEDNRIVRLMGIKGLEEFGFNFEGTPKIVDEEEEEDEEEHYDDEDEDEDDYDQFQRQQSNLKKELERRENMWKREQEDVAEQRVQEDLAKARERRESVAKHKSEEIEEEEESGVDGKREVMFEGKVLFISPITHKDEVCLFAYQGRKEFERDVRNNNVSKHISVGTYRAFRQAIKEIVQSAKIKVEGLIYPVMSYEPKSNAIMYYVKNLIVMNNAIIKPRHKKFPLKSKIIDIVMIVCHELAHIKHSAHSSAFVKTYNRLVTIALGYNEDKELILDQVSRAYKNKL